jgi:hypothetical protein
MTRESVEALKTTAGILAAFAAVLLGFYGVVTRPLEREIDGLRQDLRMEIKAEFSRMHTEIAELRGDLARGKKGK